jgi:predicted transcriptional regulator
MRKGDLRWTENREALLNHLWTVEGPHTVDGLYQDKRLTLSIHAVRYDLRRLEIENLASRERIGTVWVKEDTFTGEKRTVRKNMPDLWSITEAGKNMAKGLEEERR